MNVLLSFRKGQYSQPVGMGNIANQLVHFQQPPQLQYWLQVSYRFRMTDLSKRQEEQKEKGDPWLEEIPSVQHIVIQFKVRECHREATSEKIEADDKWEGAFLPLMTVLQFIPSQRKRVHSVCAIWCNSTQILLLHWKEILFSSRHLWPGTLDRLTSVRSAKTKKVVNPASWSYILSA